jgi:hypothetical protein
LRSLRSFDTGTPNQVQVSAELSATTRDDSLLEQAVSLFCAEAKVRAVRWSIPAADLARCRRAALVEALPYVPPNALRNRNLENARGSVL